MSVIFSTPYQRLMYVQEPAQNIFFHTSEKKYSLAENAYVLWPYPFGMSFWSCQPTAVHVRLFLSVPTSHIPETSYM